MCMNCLLKNPVIILPSTSKGSFSYSSLPYNHWCCPWQCKEHNWMTKAGRARKELWIQMDYPVAFEKTKNIMSCMNKFEIHLKNIKQTMYNPALLPFCNQTLDYLSSLEAWFLAWNPHVWIRKVPVTGLQDLTFISSRSLWKYSLLVLFTLKKNRGLKNYIDLSKPQNLHESKHYFTLQMFTQ